MGLTAFMHGGRAAYVLPKSAGPRVRDEEKIGPSIRTTSTRMSHLYPRYLKVVRKKRSPYIHCSEMVLGFWSWQPTRCISAVRGSGMEAYQAGYRSIHEFSHRAS